MGRAIQNITSRFVLDEVASVLTDKFSRPRDYVIQVLEWLLLFSDFVLPEERVSVLAHDPDNRILDCGLAGQADFIISGDRHLLDLKSFGAIKIVNPAEFLQLS